ncbi:hypothetical protein Q9233_001718, partial [Columba guinea]
SAPSLLCFSIFLEPTIMVYLCWDHDEQEVMTFEPQVHTTGWVAFGFSPHGELPGSDIVIGGVFPNGSIYFSFAVPVQETKYACAFIPLPMIKQKHHIYKFEPVITPHNITLVHPIPVYACGNTSVLPSGTGDCYGANPDFSLCFQVHVGWAVGGESYQFPNEAGISIGTLRDPQYIQLEIHYSNFDLLPGESSHFSFTVLIDSSGMRIYHMPELRKYDVGVLQTGVFIFPVHFIPPGAESYRSYGLCNSSQFDECDLLCSLGDEILVECNYETLDWSRITSGGLSTMDEMCLTFLFYCPRNNISSCLSYSDILHVACVLKREASE